MWLAFELDLIQQMMLLSFYRKFESIQKHRDSITMVLPFDDVSPVLILRIGRHKSA